MSCETIQAAISARMDGEHMPASELRTLDSHLGTCPRCRAFRDGSATIRMAVRIRPAEDVPDMTDTIMRAVRVDGGARPRRPGRIRPASPARRHPGPIAAAIAVGLVAGSVAVGGPWQSPSTRPIAAAAVVRDVRAAAAALTAYQATFAIVERGLSTVVPERRFSMQVAFRSPGRFRIDVRDESTYPSDAWTPTDLTYIADGPSTYRSGPSGCPGDLPVDVCPPTRATVVRNTRIDTGAPLAVDLILPLTTLGASEGIEVLGTDTTLGRPSVRVELPFARAAPLFPFLRLGGTWRPFFPGDRVVLTLDRQSWFPLRATVYPSSDPARRSWELRFGLPVERTHEAILDERVLTFDERPPSLDRFAIPGGTAGTVPLGDVSGRVGYVPVTPTRPGDLNLVSAVIPRSADADGPTSLLTYARGLAYLTVGERSGWRGPGPFGPVGTQAEVVRLAGDGLAYYAPASADHGRILSVHADGTDLFLETNLSRDRLLAVAASLPVLGEPIPAAWSPTGSDGIGSERVSLADARRRAGFPIELPRSMPAGSVLASVELTVGAGAAGVTLTFAQRAVDVAGGAIRFHVEPGAALPPASSASQELVAFAGGVTARWTPSWHRLEWVRGGLYRSLDGPGLDLATATAIAASVPAGAAPGAS